MAGNLGTSCSTDAHSGPGVPTVSSSAAVPRERGAAVRARARARGPRRRSAGAASRGAAAAGAAARALPERGRAPQRATRIAPSAWSNRYLRCTRRRSSKNGSSGIPLPRSGDRVYDRGRDADAGPGHGDEAEGPEFRGTPGLSSCGWCLPGRLGHAGQLATVRHVTEADTRDAELREDTAGAAVDDVARTHAHGRRVAGQLLQADASGFALLVGRRRAKRAPSSVRRAWRRSGRRPPCAARCARSCSS